MIIFFKKHHLAISLISVIGISFSSVNLHAYESESLSKNIETETKDFLSDPARAGSLVGTILVGAAIANPLAPILGSIAGFFIGKNTDYTYEDKVQKKTFVRRSLIPSNNLQVASLSGLSEKQPQQAKSPNMAEPVDELSVSVGEQVKMTEPSINLGLPKETEGNRGSGIQQQLAYACSNVDVTQNLPIYCYYYSQ